jgi:hypothetical protein
VNLINLLIQKEQSRKFQELNKKEEKINTVIINIIENKFYIDQIKSLIFNDLSKFYQYFKTIYYLINQDIAVVNLINLLIQKEQSRKFQKQK